MEKKLWLLSELFYPDQTSTGYIMTEIAESLAASKRVHVICGPEGYSPGTLDSGRLLHKNIIIDRVKAGNGDKNKVISRISRMFMLTITMAWRLFRKAIPGDTVLMVTNPAPLLVLVSRICKWKKLKLIIIVHDVFPENMHAAGMISKKSPVYRFLLYLFNSAYRAADLLLVLGRDMKEIILDKTRLAEDKVQVIENWADVVNIYPLDNISGKCLKFQFAGNFGRVQGLMPLLKAIHAADNRHIRMEFIGSGAMGESLKTYVSEYQLSNVSILPPFNREEQLKVLNNCDVSIVSLAPGMAGLGVPSKAYNILAAGKPILFIGDSNSEIALMIREANIGWVFHSFSDELVSFFKELDPATFKAEIDEKGIAARKLAESKYSKRIILERYNTAIRSL